MKKAKPIENSENQNERLGTCNVPSMTPESGGKKSFSRFLTNKLRLIKNYELDIDDIHTFIKTLRTKLGLRKSPKKKGYGKFFTDEEKRYLVERMALNK